MERDKKFKSKNPYNRNFNSHAHVERDTFDAFLIDNSVNFNSHAHVERDQQLRHKQKQNQISTHTLTWSVTRKD